MPSSGCAASSAARALLPPDVSLLALEPRTLLLSAVKPAEAGDAIIVRVLNPPDGAVRAVLGFGFRVTGVEAVRLDETRSGERVTATPTTVELDVPPRALRSILLVPQQS